MDTLLTHRKKIREPIYPSSKMNRTHSKLRIEILPNFVPNFKLNISLSIEFRLNHKRTKLTSLISILMIAGILTLLLTTVIVLAIAIILRIDHRTVISQDSRTRIPPLINRILPHSLSNQAISRRGHRFRCLRQQNRPMAVWDAVEVHKEQTLQCKPLVHHTSPRDGHLRAHHRYEAECSKFH